MDIDINTLEGKEITGISKEKTHSGETFCLHFSDDSTVCFTGVYNPINEFLGIKATYKEGKKHGN